MHNIIKQEAKPTPHPLAGADGQQVHNCVYGLFGLYELYELYEWNQCISTYLSLRSNVTLFEIVMPYIRNQATRPTPHPVAGADGQPVQYCLEF